MANTWPVLLNDLINKISSQLKKVVVIIKGIITISVSIIRTYKAVKKDCTPCDASSLQRGDTRIFESKPLTAGTASKEQRQSEDGHKPSFDCLQPGATCEGLLNSSTFWNVCFLKPAHPESGDDGSFQSWEIGSSVGGVEGVPAEEIEKKGSGW